MQGWHYCSCEVTQVVAHVYRLKILMMYLQMFVIWPLCNEEGLATKNITQKNTDVTLSYPKSNVYCQLKHQVTISSQQAGNYS